MGQTVHTYPVNDLIDHETEGDGCPCGPTVECVPCEDAPDGWLIVHHSSTGASYASKHAEIVGAV